MGDIPRSKILQLSKSHLGLPSSAPDEDVPDFYTKELEYHLTLCPQDDNFRVTLEPRSGFGKVHCLEKGCEGVVIQLQMREEQVSRDGGRADGLGSLLCYRIHAVEHPTHAKSRFARIEAAKNNNTSAINNATPSMARESTRLVKMEPGKGLPNSSASSPSNYAPRPTNPSNPAPASAPVAKRVSSLIRVKPELVKTEPGKGLPNASASSHSNYAPRPTNPSAPASAPVAKRVSSLIRIKPETVEPQIQRKRVSDIAFESTLAKSERDRAVAPSNALVTSPGKKVKREPSLKTPLAPANHNASPLAKTSTSQAANIPTLSVSEIRSELEDIQTMISSTQIKLSAAQRKRTKSKADNTRINTYKTQLERLKQKKEEYNALIPSSLVAMQKTTSNALADRQSESGITSVAPPPAFNNPAFNRRAQPQPVASGSSARLPDVKMEDDWNENFVSKIQNSLPAAARLPKTEPMQNSDVKMEDSKPKYPKAIVGDPLSVYSESANLIAVTKPPIPHFNASHSNSDSRSSSPEHDPDYYDYDPAMFGPAAAMADVLVDQMGIVAPPPMRGAENFDEQGNYFGRGKDLFMGPQAKADDIDKFLIEAGNAEAFDGNASVDKALARLGLKSQYELIPGMEVALMPHQTIGVAWMVDKEMSNLKGGCLGDDMGLGKTVQMIAVMMKNKSENPACKTNLVIAPTALLDQWKMEIEMKTNSGLKCLVYHGQSKPKKKQDLLNYDIVLTTYMTMSLEWPDLEGDMKKKTKAQKNRKKKDLSSDDEDSEDYGYTRRKPRKEAGLLFQVNFYRVILDEAQNIRNRRTRMSRSVTALRSTYRWRLTGTPIINSLSDVYGYIRFLQIRPWYDFTEFQSRIGILERKNPKLAISRLQTINETFLFRRLKNSMLDGKRLIELPEKKVDLIKLEFSSEEREIYQMIESRTQDKFNRFLRAGTVLKNYHQVLVLLLRLRQVCSHPTLIQEGGVAFINSDEVHEDDKKSAQVSTELTRASRLISPEFVSKLKQKLKDSALQRLADEKASVHATVEDEECPICFEALSNPTVTACGHYFCRTCIVEHIRSTPKVEVTQGEPVKYKASERPCPSCRDPISEENLFNRSAFEPSEKELLGIPADSDVEVIDVDASPFNARRGARRPHKTSKRYIRVLDTDEEAGDIINSDADTNSEDELEDDDDLSDFIMQSDEDEEEKDARRVLRNRMGKRKMNVVLDSDEEMEDAPKEEREVIFGIGNRKNISPDVLKKMPRFLPSSKMKYMMEQLKKSAKERPEEKTLVISQWTGCLSLVSDYLTENGIVHVKYQGDMTRPKRDQAVRVFMARDKARVMLMSLKCGGVGLNLTRANNVISLDLGWSQAIESQAFDRVHRLGQTRAVNVQRVVIADTVEDRILALQERKQTLADGSLGEGTGKKIGKLSVAQLANLFGLDHRGRALNKDN